MAGLQIHRSETSGAVTLKLEGKFDRQTALEVNRSLEELGACAVILDFSRVREFMDLAVPVLSQYLMLRPVELRGLDQHRHRMFRYFGVLAARTAEREYYTPEEVLAV